MGKSKKGRTTQKSLEKAAKDLNIEPPKSRESFGVRMLAYAMIVGGLSIIGSVFVSIFEPQHSFNTYTGTILRIGVGSFILLTAYGILKRRQWSLWGFGVLVAFSIFTNPTLALFLGGAFVFLLYHRRHFVKGAFFLLGVLLFISFFRSIPLFALIMFSLFMLTYDRRGVRGMKKFL